ncbi:MAG: prephenate dehydratase [Thermoprotei archaeon]
MRDKIRVGFQGEHGAYSEEALLSRFPNSEPIGYKSFREVFDAVEKNECDFAVIPIENSLEGAIGEVHDLLFEYPLMVRGEIILRIKHNLLVLPGVMFDDIKDVYSHPQALIQCSSFITRYRLNPIAVYDTAGAAKLLREKNDIHSAVIASKRAAEIYGLAILMEGIENNINNYTRFLIIGTEDIKNPTGSDKTSIIFGVHHVPGALYRALESFAKRNINLTRIESRPSKRKPWEYLFYVDFEGHRFDKEVSSALQELQQVTSIIKILGSYPASNSFI